MITTTNSGIYFPKHHLRALAVILVFPFALAGCTKDEEPSVFSSGQVDFNWDVRPILSDKCFQCHGPDKAGLKAGLRLDDRELAIAELPESPGRFAIVPGSPETSELVARITADNIDDRMPPESTHKTLTSDEIATLQQWIKEGAEYKPHWAFIPPTEPQIPATADTGHVNNAIDNFILGRLEQADLTSSPEASREALINRVSLTLTGLPPSLETVDAFVADNDPDAYQNLVDKLLASPRYGEHMAAYWMDLARWSESDGFLDDHHDRFLWPWRDWVIKALNDNMPFDEFATKQLAGDLLPNATQDDLLATAFIRIGKRTTENGAIEEEYSAEYRAERTDNLVGTTFLGLTMGCARCHDHRYDPISQKDYYAISAFFNNNNEPGVYSPGFSGIQGGPTLPWPDDNTRVRISQAEEEINRLEQAYQDVRNSALQAAENEVSSLTANADNLDTYLADSVTDQLAAFYPFDTAQKAGLDDLPPREVRRIPPPSINGLMGGPYAPPLDPSKENERQRKERENRELEGRVPRNYNKDMMYLSSAVGQAPEAVLQDPQLNTGYKGQAMYFNETNKGFLGKDVGKYDRTDPFSLDFRFLVAQDYDEASVLNHMAEQNSGKTGYQLAIRDGKLFVSFAHSPPANMISMISRDKLPVGEWSHITLTYDGSSKANGISVFLDGQLLDMEIQHDSLTRSMLPWGTGDVFDPFVGLTFGTRFRVKAPIESGLDEIRVYDKTLNPLEVAYLHDPAMLPTLGRDMIREQLTQLVTDNNDQVQQAQANLITARQAHNDLVTAVPQVLVMGTAPGHEDTFVLNRGVYSEKGEKVSPRALDVVLPWDESLPENRLGLAKWLFDPQNPLTARVFVNRIWQLHFGQGLVETSEDFGSQGSTPTHPDLLDWLTTQFIESGWDIKALHRLIVTSYTYKQDSDLNEQLLAKDPGNQLYARGPRWRMTAEMIRDQALFLSGKLNDSIGGPSATPYQPEDIWNPLNSFYSYPEPEDIPEDEHHRRTLYTFIKRNAPHPALGIFDFQNRTTSIARRRSSNTPLQALVLMNDPQYLETYRLMAQNVLAFSSDDSTRLSRLFRIATRTTPDEDKLGILERYYHEQVAWFAENRDQADELLSAGVVAADPDLDNVELAAMANVAAVIMNAPDTYVVK